MSIDREHLLKAFARYRDWYLHDVLPLWTAQGYDETRGGFYEALDFDGTPLADLDRRVRVQSRQIYVFSEVGRRGWRDDAEALAAKAFDFYLAHACPEDGARGCVHVLAADGSVEDDRRDLYDQAFLLLSCAARWNAAKDDRAMALANKTADFLDRELRGPAGGWLEDSLKTLPRRQNPHMHLFEAFMALFAATGDARWRAKLDETYALMSERFFDDGRGIIREFFDEEMNPLEDRAVIEPGHMFEWVWLLRNYENATGVDTGAQRRKLFESGVLLGADAGFHGFVDNAISVAGARQSGAKRLWPQTEFLKAALVAASDGQKDAEGRAVALINDQFTTYLAAKKSGLWIDEFDKDGAAIAPHVPASILYHLFEAVVETERYATLLDAS